MNIVEAYIKLKGQFIIIVSGIEGCGKSVLVKKLHKNLNISRLSQTKFYKEDYDTKYKLPNGTEVVNWDSDDAIDWKSFNDKVDKMKGNGVIVTGLSFNKDKIKFKPDYQFHITMKKKECFNKKKEFINKNKDKYSEEFKDYESGKAKLVFNQLTFPYYQESMSSSNINKYLNASKFSLEELWETSYEIIIKHIENYLYNVHKYTENDRNIYNKNVKSEPQPEFYNEEQEDPDDLYSTSSLSSFEEESEDNKEVTESEEEQTETDTSTNPSTDPSTDIEVSSVKNTLDDKDSTSELESTTKSEQNSEKEVDEFVDNFIKELAEEPQKGGGNEELLKDKKFMSNINIIKKIVEDSSITSPSSDLVMEGVYYEEDTSPYEDDQSTTPITRGMKEIVEILF